MLRFSLKNARLFFQLRVLIRGAALCLTTLLIFSGQKAHSNVVAQRQNAPVFKVAALLPLTGLQAERGVRMRAGVEQALAYLRARKYKVEVEFVDSGSLHQTAAKWAVDLASAKSQPHAVLLGVELLSARKVQTHLERAKIPYFLINVDDQSLMRTAKFGQLVSATLEQKVEAAWNFSKSNLGATKVALFLPLEHGRIENFLKFAMDKKPKATELKVFSYAAQSDLTADFDAAKEFQPDVLWVPWVGERFQEFLPAMKQRGWTRPYLGFDELIVERVVVESDVEGEEAAVTYPPEWLGNFLLEHFHPGIAPANKTDLAVNFIRGRGESSVALPLGLEALSFESLLLATRTFEKSAFRGKGLSYMKMLKRYGSFEGLVGSYRILPNGTLKRPLLTLRSSKNGFQVQY